MLSYIRVSGGGGCRYELTHQTVHPAGYDMSCLFQTKPGLLMRITMCDGVCALYHRYVVEERDWKQITCHIGPNRVPQELSVLLLTCTKTIATIDTTKNRLSLLKKMFL